MCYNWWIIEQKTVYFCWKIWLMEAMSYHIAPQKLIHIRSGTGCLLWSHGSFNLTNGDYFKGLSGIITDTVKIPVIKIYLNMMHKYTTASSKTSVTLITTDEHFLFRNICILTELLFHISAGLKKDHDRHKANIVTGHDMVAKRRQVITSPNLDPVTIVKWNTGMKHKAAIANMV